MEALRGTILVPLYVNIVIRSELIKFSFYLNKGHPTSPNHLNLFFYSTLTLI